MLRPSRNPICWRRTFDKDDGEQNSISIPLEKVPQMVAHFFVAALLWGGISRQRDATVVINEADEDALVQRHLMPVPVWAAIERRHDVGLILVLIWWSCDGLRWLK